MRQRRSFAATNAGAERGSSVPVAAPASLGPVVDWDSSDPAPAAVAHRVVLVEA